MPAPVQLRQMGVGGEAAVEDEVAQRSAVVLGEVEELDHPVVGAGAAHAGVGAQQQTAVGLLGQGRRDADHGLPPGAAPVLLQGVVVAPVRQRGEVQVGRVAEQLVLGGHARHAAQQAPVHGAGGAVGIGGEPRGLGQHVEPGEQAQAAIHAPQVVGAVAADMRQLEGQHGQHRLQRGQGARAGIAGLLDDGVDAVVPQPGQQAEDAGGALALEGFVVAGIQAGAAGGALGGHGGCRALRAGAARQARAAGLVEHALDDPFARGGGPLGVQLGLDVGNGKLAVAEFQDALAESGADRLRGASATVGRHEKGRRGVVETAEFADEAIDGGRGDPEAPGECLGSEVLREEEAQDFEPHVAGMCGACEELDRLGRGHGDRLA